jgi:SAM-dependent methyltransferase
MPADVKPLFRPDAVRPKLAGFTVPPSAVAARPKLADWVKLLDTPAGRNKKETELLPAFLTDVFVGVLGYTSPPAAEYTFKREALVQADGKYADAGLGRFGGEKDHFVAVLEGKGPKDPLDIPFAGRKLSAVDQALKYAVNTPTDWYLVTNLREIRLYSKQADQRTYERFELAKLADDDGEFGRFVFLLGAERLLDPAGSHLSAVLADSARLGRELTRQFYDEYRALRHHFFDALRTHNPTQDPARLLTATQKILDRVLFIAFAEDRKLLPGDIIARAYQHTDAFNPRPVWDNFKHLFRAVDKGSKQLDIWQYNGGLFADDPFIDALIVPDSVCAGFKLLSDYEYGGTANADAPLVDVDILGHVFEQSISDLEEMQNVIAGLVAAPKANEKTSRKEAGAFYTPEFVTRYIVAETLGPVLADRFETLRAGQQQQAVKTAKKVLDDPATFDADALTKPQTAALAEFWDAWVADLQAVRVVDPACGSGAFLIEAFDQMFAEYQKAKRFLTVLRGQALFDPQKSVLEHNLYGVDLNGAAVDIARLSCWIKTAEYGQTLTSLDAKIVQGNSVVSDPAFSPDAFDWKQRFADVFAAGGFDVVIGNPPYVRQEWIKAIKPHLQQHYKAYDGTADLYVYFYELGLNLLKPGGRLGYITSNRWLKAGYGEGLRTLLGESPWVEQVTDFGHAKQIFPDADVSPSILIAGKPIAASPPTTD